MLLKTKISRIKILSDEWFENRLGKLTSSEIFNLMGDRFWTTGCQSYIYRKVGEMIAGRSVKGEIETEATAWGLVHEADAIKKFAISKGLEYIICQQLITEPGSRFGSTPDGLIIHRESADKTAYDVSTIEIKCPPTYNNYVSLALCETPEHLKNENKKYYWQVLDQMENCDALVAYFVVYHPDFKNGNMRVIEFRKMQNVDGKYPIANDIKLLKERKQMAVEKMTEVYEKLQSMQSM